MLLLGPRWLLARNGCRFIESHAAREIIPRSCILTGFSFLSRALRVQTPGRGRDDLRSSSKRFRDSSLQLQAQRDEHRALNLSDATRFAAKRCGAPRRLDRHSDPFFFYLRCLCFCFCFCHFAFPSFSPSLARNRTISVLGLKATLLRQRESFRGNGCN